MWRTRLLKMTMIAMLLWSFHKNPSQAMACTALLLLMGLCTLLIRVGIVPTVAGTLVRKCLLIAAILTLLIPSLYTLMQSIPEPIYSPISGIQGVFYTATFTPAKSVAYIELICTKTFIPANGSTFFYQHAMGEWYSASTGIFIDQTSEEAGLLGEINDSVQQGANQIAGEIQAGTDAVTDKIDQQTEEQKNMFEKLLDGIINGLKSLFIPGDVTDPETGQQISYFTHYFNEWDAWMQDHFGVLYFPFAILFDVLDQILSFKPPDNPTITFPSLEIMGQTLLEPIEYDFTTFDMPWLNTAHDLYLFAVDAIIGFWLVRLAYKKLTEIMGGGS